MSHFGHAEHLDRYEKFQKGDGVLRQVDLFLPLIIQDVAELNAL